MSRTVRPAVTIALGSLCLMATLSAVAARADAA
jgi:hypothetical protein